MARIVTIKGSGRVFAPTALSSELSADMAATLRQLGWGVAGVNIEKPAGLLSNLVNITIAITATVNDSASRILDGIKNALRSAGRFHYDNLDIRVHTDIAAGSPAPVRASTNGGYYNAGNLATVTVTYDDSPVRSSGNVRGWWAAAPENDWSTWADSNKWTIASLILAGVLLIRR